MRYKLKALSILCVFALLYPMPSADAQWTNYDTGRTFNNPISSMLDTMLLHSMQRNMLERRLLGERDEESTTAVQVPPEPPLLAASFEPQEAILPVQLASQIPNLSPDEQKAVVDFYRNLLSVYDSALLQNGENDKRHNVSSALAYLVYACDLILQNGQGLMEDVQQGLVRHLHAAVVSTPEFNNTDNQMKQVIYEAFVITAGYLFVVYQQAAQTQDMNQLQEVRRIARENIQTVLGASYDQVKFTADGIVYLN